MKRSTSLLPTTFLLALFAWPAAAAPLPGAPQDGWATYRVPMQPDAQAPCCWRIARGDVKLQHCSLDRDEGLTIHGDVTISNGIALSDAVPRTGAGEELAVYLHYTGGVVDRVRSFGAACPVDAQTAPAALDGITPARSVELLDALAQTAERKRLAEEATTALAFHAGAAATTRLVALAGGERPRQVRESAIFWLGQLRGREGAAAIERIARGDESRQIREHAVFSLSQSKAVDGYSIIKDIAATDPSRHVRSQSLFWMAQTGDLRGRADIIAALRREQDGGAQEQAVFALSQLREGGDAALIDVVRGDYPRRVKKQALFWLGQSGSDEAIRFVDSVIGDAAAAK